MVTISAITDAVVTELNNGAWSLPFIAVRLYRPRFEAAELKTLKVSVVPRSLTIEAADRAYDGRQYQVDVAIQQKLDREDTEEIDTFLQLVDEIARYFKMRRLAAEPSALCIKVENEPIYSVEHLDEFKCFTSVITLTLRTIG